MVVSNNWKGSGGIINDIFSQFSVKVKSRVSALVSIKKGKINISVELWGIKAVRDTN